MSPAAKRRAEAEPAGTDVLTARKEGREVVTLRSFDEADAWIVECDVYPVTAMRVDPLRPGPYRFPSPELAQEFLQEATRALEHLGCDVEMA